MSAEHIVALEGEVYLHLRRELHQLALHLLTVLRLTAQRELDAGTDVLGRVLDALAACHTADGVDIKALVGNDAGGTLYLARLQLTTHDHQDVAVLALMAHPVLVLVVGDRREADVHT